MSCPVRLAILVLALGALIAGGISVASGTCLRRRTASAAMFAVHGTIRNHYDARRTLPDSWEDLDCFLSEHDARGIPKWVEIEVSVQVDDLARLFDADIAMNPLHHDFVHGLGAPPIELVRYRAMCAWTTASANRWNRLLLHELAIEIQIDRARGGEGREGTVGDVGRRSVEGWKERGEDHGSQSGSQTGQAHRRKTGQAHRRWPWLPS